jgi:acyl-coenzyme A thioesterase PaaI-like protein
MADPNPSLPNIDHVPECAACGVGGLGLIRSTDGERAYGEVLLRREHSGYSRKAHGGMIAMFLDDVLGTIPQVYGYLAVTGTLEIRYRRPGVIGQRYTLEAWLVSEQGRRLEIAGEMTDEDGVIAEASGTWVRVDHSHFA